MDLYEHLVLLAAGISFFMYGMGLASDSLQLLAADRLRALMAQLAKNRFYAIVSGILLTVILQSSSAVTVMLVNLASAGIVTLSQVMGVIVGTAIGTTVTVQLISFNVTRFAPYFLILGFGILFMSQKKKIKTIGSIIFGFGLIFYGLLLMGQAVTIVKDFQGFQNAFRYLNENPMVAFAATTFLTAIVHSSAVTIGLAMTLVGSHVMTLHDSMYWIAGANLGTTATALFASLSSRHTGKQVAWAHFFYKAVSVVLLLLFAGPFTRLVGSLTEIASHQIADAHTLFNIISAILFVPFIKYGVRFIEKVFPKPVSENEFGPKYLDPRAFSEPSLAYSNSVREMLRMAEYTLEMVNLSLSAFEKDSPDLISEVRIIDKKIDTLNREIKIYLVRLTDESLNEIQNAKVVSIIALVSDIENIGDVIDKNVLMLAEKKCSLKVTFSDAGWNDMKEFHGLVVKNFELAISSFSMGSRDLAKKVIDHKHELRLMEQKFRETHIQRLHNKMQDSVNTSNIHFDLLSAYRRVNSYASNLAYSVLFGDPRNFETTIIDQKKSS